MVRGYCHPTIRQCGTSSAAGLRTWVDMSIDVRDVPKYTTVTIPVEIEIALNV